MISKYPWYPNIHDIQISMISKCPWCGHTCHVWWHLGHVVTLVTCGHTCHMLSHLSHVVTLVTCGHNCHTWPQLTHVVTLVTCGHTCHMLSHLSHAVILFTYRTNVSTSDQKSELVILGAIHLVCTHGCANFASRARLRALCNLCVRTYWTAPYGDEEETRCTYRPAWTQVKIICKRS